MNKKTILGVIIFIVGGIFLYGGIRALPDFKALGAAAGLMFFGIVVTVTAFLNKKWNWKMYLGMALAMAGEISAFAVIDRLPDWRPFLSMGVICVIGAVLFAMGFVRAKFMVPGKTVAWFDFFGSLVAAGLLIISALLAPQIDWSWPKDPAGVMMLTAFSGLLVIYALRKNHPAKHQIVWAGFIGFVNFWLVPLYERGLTDFLGKFYRLFIPLYEKFDAYAERIEYALIIITVILALVLIIKKVRVRDYGSSTLWYFLLMPVLAIFLFEMMGLPAGFLSGVTTRSDLLVTDTNAAMSTFGILFIGVAMYMVFQLFPFWVAPILAGLWWVYWKPWLLHHPNPGTWTDFAAFWPAGKFLFLTGLKRVVLPMVLIIAGINLFKRKK